MTKPMYPNLAAEMKREGITGKAMASGLGVHSSGFYLILQGKRSLTIGMAHKIRAKFFPDLTIDYLFDVEDERKAG